MNEADVNKTASGINSVSSDEQQSSDSDDFPSDVIERSASSSFWSSPMVWCFTVVLALFVLTLILASINLCIYYADKAKHKRNALGEKNPYREIKPSAVTSAGQSRTVAPNMAFMYFCKKRTESEQSADRNTSTNTSR